MPAARTKAELLAQLAGRIGARSYLEIGVKSGDTLFLVPARFKVGVDPDVRITRRQRLRASRIQLGNASCRLFEETSDEFFARHADRARPREGFDLVFVDGKHTWGQAVCDARAALELLSPRGLVVLHDANPATEAQAFPAESFEEAALAEPPGWTRAWCGDVWKAVVQLRAEAPRLALRTMRDDMGLAVLNPRLPADPIDLTAADLPSLSFADLDSKRDAWLNLCDSDDVLAWLEHDPALQRADHKRAADRAFASARTIRVGAPLVAATALLLLVALPESLGDKPYDAKPSAWPRELEHAVSDLRRSPAERPSSNRTQLA
jgi:hypothetical protein